jgi:dTDP-4-dehydrorhamnose reductase
MKKYLILGASGLLGSKLLIFFPQSHGTFFKNKIGTNKNISYLDVTDKNSFHILLEHVRPDVVINCTGITNIDLCEKFPEKCWKLNSWQPLQIAQDCGARAIKYVHISTDNFLNLREIKLKESDKVVPINQYGFSKLSAESFIRSANKHSLIIRTNFFHFNLDSPKTFLDYLVNGIKQKKVFHSFSDVFFTPISTIQLAKYIEALVDIDVAGVVNIASSEVLSKFDFHNAVLKEMHALSDLHLPVLLDSVKLHAQRPRYMALDNSLLERSLGVKVASIYDMIKTELQLSK